VPPALFQFARQDHMENTPNLDAALEADAFRPAMMKALKLNGIAEVIIEFDGCGDEGQVQGISCTKLDGSEGSLEFPSSIPGTTITAGASVWSSQRGRYVVEPDDRSSTMAELLDRWTYLLLDKTGVDWVNNEGGYGEIVIIPATDTIECHINQRFIGTVASHHEL